jgi:hypothetical protein
VFGLISATCSVVHRVVSRLSTTSTAQAESAV